MGVFITFLLAILAGLATAEELKINALVDTLLNDVAKNFQESGTDILPIQDMEKDFKIIFVKGGLKATKGVFSNLATVKRTGDAIIDLEEDKASLIVNLGLNDCEVYFEHCRAWLGFLSTSERLSAAVTDNSLEAKISLNVVGENCTTTVDEVHLTRLSGFNVDLKSLGIIRYIANHVVDWIIDFFENSIRNHVEVLLKSAIEAQLDKVDFCSLI